MRLVPADLGAGQGAWHSFAHASPDRSPNGATAREESSFVRQIPAAGAVFLVMLDASSEMKDLREVSPRCPSALLVVAWGMAAPLSQGCAKGSPSTKRHLCRPRFNVAPEWMAPISREIAIHLRQSVANMEEGT